MHRRYVLSALMASALLFGTAAVDPRPDFSGVWERFPDPYNESDEYPPPPGDGPVLKEPYASTWKAWTERVKAGDRDGRPVADDSTRCLPEGMPTIMGAVYPIEIFQTPRQMVVLAELFTQTRRIFLDDPMPKEDEIVPSYNGYSVGHFEKDVLVIETRGVRDDIKFAPFGIPHSRRMKITERLRLVGADQMEDSFTIEDPEVLAKPYVFTFGYKRKPDYKIIEYYCDNNRSRIDADGKVGLDIK